MAKRSKALPSLSEKQREIMDVIWELGDASVYDVRKVLLENRDVARNTVRTMMERLEEKGWLVHEVIGRTYRYRPTIKKQESLGRRFLEFIEGACGGSPESLMSALLEHRGLSDGEISRIQKMLNDAKEKGGS